MHIGERMHVVEANAMIMDAMEELTRTGMGLVIVCD